MRMPGRTRVRAATFPKAVVEGARARKTYQQQAAALRRGTAAAREHPSKALAYAEALARASMHLPPFRHELSLATALSIDVVRAALCCVVLVHGLVACWLGCIGHELSRVSFASAKRGTNKSGWPREDLSRPGQNSDTCLSARSTASGRSSRGFLVAAVSRVRWRARLIIFLSIPRLRCRAVLLMPAFATAFACRRPPTLTPAMAERAAEYFKPRIIGPRVQATNAR
jgi:hypothetical protein